jgi:hypothetical protein
VSIALKLVACELCEWCFFPQAGAFVATKHNTAKLNSIVHILITSLLFFCGVATLPSSPQLKDHYTSRLLFVQLSRCHARWFAPAAT